jgi:hypothetical protein
MGLVTNATQENQPLNSDQLRKACREIRDQHLNIQGIQERLSWALDDDIVDAIESHGQALLSEVRRIEEVATPEA